MNDRGKNYRPYFNSAYVGDSYHDPGGESRYVHAEDDEDLEYVSRPVQRSNMQHYDSDTSSESRYDYYSKQQQPAFQKQPEYIQPNVEERNSRNVSDWLKDSQVSIPEPQHDPYFEQPRYSGYNALETPVPPTRYGKYVKNETYYSDEESTSGEPEPESEQETSSVDQRYTESGNYQTRLPFHSPPTSPSYNKKDEYMPMDELMQQVNPNLQDRDYRRPSAASISTDERANNFHEIDLHGQDSRSSPRKPMKNSKMTMRNAQKVAKQLGMMRDEEDDMEESEDEASGKEGSVNLEPPFKLTQRKCWAKACWSRKKHSHALRPGDARQRAKLLQSPTSGAGISTWDQQQQKAKKQVKDWWKEALTFLHIWNKPMKTIEGQYGTGVVSYFMFLRWLLYLNIAIFLMVFLVIVLPKAIDHHSSGSASTIASTPTSTSAYVEDLTESPQVHQWAPLANVPSNSLEGCALSDEGDCHKLYLATLKNRTEGGINNLLDFLQGTGWMENTALFPGWYTPRVKNFLSSSGKHYNLSLAYVLVTLVYFLLCLVMMVAYTTTSVREALKSTEGHLHQYCNLVFGGWDYCIEEANTASRKHQSITQELRSNLAEERRRQEIAGWTTKKWLTVYLWRVLANALVLAILAGALYGIYSVCRHALDAEKEGMGDFAKLMTEFSPSLTVTALNIVLPIIFGQLVTIENYTVDTEIKVTLIRTVFVRLASVASLIGTFYVQVNCKIEERGPPCNVCRQQTDFQCWESYVGQQIYKLVIMDFIVVFFTVFLMDFPRRLIVKHCQCKLSQIIGYQEFDIPKNVLDLVYSQTLCWLGTFFSPLLPAICLLKFLIFFYIKKLTLMMNYVPSKIPYRASKSNTFFVIVLMLSFVLSAVPVGFTIAQIPPSKGCGPFRNFKENMWSAVKCSVQSSNDKHLTKALEFLTSAGFGVPLFIVLCLAIYYYSTVSEANRHMVQVLKDQLVLEGKDKQFLLARLTDVTKLHRLPNK